MKISKGDSKLFLCKLQMNQKLSDELNTEWTAFGHYCFNGLENNFEALKRVVSSDECKFRNLWKVSKQNCPIDDLVCPRKVYKALLKSLLVTV